jgi:hypothetical protein
MKKILAGLAAAAAVALTIGGGFHGVSIADSSSATTSKAGPCAGYEPVLDPSNFVGTIDNPYFPLPVGSRGS